jgi:hypothetical protein
MANVYLSLPVPAADGAGAAVDCSTMGSMRSVVAGVTPGPSGEGMRCTINIEISNALAAPAAADEWSPLCTFNNDFGGDQTVAVAAKWMRAVRSASKSPAGTPTVAVGSTDDGTTRVNLAAPAGDGSAAATDTSALGPWKTVTVGSAFRGNVNIEISEDGVFFSPEFSFPGNGGQLSAAVMSKFMRVSRDGVPVISPGLPIVNIGAAAMPGGGGSGSGGAAGEQFFTVTGVAGQSLYNVTLPTPRADANYEVIPIVNSPAANTDKAITVDPTTIAIGGFTAEMTTGAEAGDILVFLIHDL